MNINIGGQTVDIEITLLTEDEIVWRVIDEESLYPGLLNKLLHKHYEDKICDLIVVAVDNERKDAEMERQVSNLECSSIERAMSRKLEKVA